MVFLLALSPILWLIVSLGVFKMPGFKACPLALVLAFAVALTEYQMAGLDAVTAALEGAALACWPILLVIIAAIFTYNLAVHTKSMDIVKHMLMTVSKDRRILALLIAWGIWRIYGRYGRFRYGHCHSGIDVSRSWLRSDQVDPSLSGSQFRFRRRTVQSAFRPVP